VSFRIPIILFAVLLSSFAYPDRCRNSVALLGNDLGNGLEGEPVTREGLLRAMASFYSEALQNTALMPAFQMRVEELASIEGASPEDLYREIEALAPSPSERRDLREEREEWRRQEQLWLYSVLEPYLARIGREDRKTIERELILPGLVDPLSLGEVDFRFYRAHSFLVGGERYHAGAGLSVTFGPENSFSIGQVPVTQFMYLLAALGAEGVEITPSHFNTGKDEVVLHLGGKEYRLNPNHPVEQVSALDAEAHAMRASAFTGLPYGLPSENQWEFANRAGSIRKYHFGNDQGLLPRFGWFNKNSGKRTHPVGQLLPNSYHLYDTHGNVREWTSSDWKFKRVFRGGSWIDDPEWSRSSSWNAWGHKDSGKTLGFRLMRENLGSITPAHTVTFGEPEPEVKPASGASNAFRLVYQRILNSLRAMGRSLK
jgi:hypothetical protein